jgi:protein-tyrosine phosphatase
VIDLHSHVLPGLDDGARTLEESVQLLELAAGEGVTAVAATPHVRYDFPTQAVEMERGVAAVQAALAANGVDILLLPGGELDYQELTSRTIDDLRRFGLGGNPRYLLIEFPYSGWPLRLPDDVDRLVAAGIVPVLAHPERNSAVAEEPRALGRMVDAGALVQLTASSISGAYGKRVRTVAQALLDGGLVHLIASDVHRLNPRRVGLAAAAESISDRALAHWLVADVPAAMVNNTPMPPRPFSPSRGLRHLLRRR